jgi:hypothetical protein
VNNEITSIIKKVEIKVRLKKREEQSKPGIILLGGRRGACGS